ncbi:MAG: radical SAM protein [Elusimicrobia bacterium]|nr:radical SAM protein [Elusimicrobiota bacterium]
MLFTPDAADSLGIITGYRCNNSCLHCLYASGPSVCEPADFGKLDLIIREIRKNIPACLVHIGGGEPLLDIKILLKTVQALIKNRICLEYVETNGRLLAESLMRENLESLKQAGLRRMLLSISPFHNEFMSGTDSRSAYRALTEVFGEDGVFGWHPEYYGFIRKAGDERPVPFRDYISFFTKEELYYQMFNIIYLHPAGRAAFLFADLFEKYPACHFFGKNCRDELSSGTHAHIDNTGNYCAGFCFGIMLGRREGFNLKRLYGRGIDLCKYPVLDILINGDLGSLYDFARKEGFDINVNKSSYSSACHLCMHIRTFLYFRYPSEFIELEPGFFYGEMKRRFSEKTY